MTARWAGTTAYTAGNLILPTVDNGRCFYCSVGGTTGSTEPAWPGRYPGVVDGSVTYGPVAESLGVSYTALRSFL